MGSNGSNKRCFLHIRTVQGLPLQSSTVSIDEITSQEFAEIQKPCNKKKKKPIIDESLCRKSNRIAHITKGFKNKATADAASMKMDIPIVQ